MARALAIRRGLFRDLLFDARGAPALAPLVAFELLSQFLDLKKRDIPLLAMLLRDPR
jgi:hypothetical protein